jgi:hypothetical protein
MPARGPEPSHRTSFAIFIRLQASVFKQPLAYCALVSAREQTHHSKQTRLHHAVDGCLRLEVVGRLRQRQALHADERAGASASRRRCFVATRTRR